jgi:biopolymer transport protein ExbB/TolQ
MPTQTDPGVWFFIDKGGVVMLIIIALSVVAFTIVLAKFWSLWRFRTHLDKLGRRVQPQIVEGNVSIALNVNGRKIKNQKEKN